MKSRWVAILATVLATGVGTANASFPYASRLGPGQAPSEFSETGDWKLAATPDSVLSNPLAIKVNNQPDELCGVRGMSLVDRQTTQPPGSCAHGAVHTAWEVTTGRPDVTIAVLDSGIECNDSEAMNDLRAKVPLDQGELPAPRHDLTTPLVNGVRCAALRAATGGDHNPHGNYDVNHDGVFNVLDYACDARVAGVVTGGSSQHALRHGPLGSFGTLDTARGARKDIVAMTRAGVLSVYRTSASACSPSSSPRFHHDNANSGDYTRDAVAPGVPARLDVHGRRVTFRAAGGDLLCGTAARYELATSRRALSATSFARARHVAIAIGPARAGSVQRLVMPRGTFRFVALRAVDAAGNVGRPLVLKIG